MKPREWYISLKSDEVYYNPSIQAPHLINVIEKSAYDELLIEAMRLREALNVYHQTRLTSFTDVSTLAIRAFDAFLEKNK